MDPNRYCWLYLIITLMDEARKIMTMNLSIIMRQDQDPDDFVQCHDVCFITSLIFLLFFPRVFRATGKFQRNLMIFGRCYGDIGGGKLHWEMLCVFNLWECCGDLSDGLILFSFSWLVVDLLNKRRKKNPKFLSLSGLAFLWSHLFSPKYEFVLILEVLLEIFPPIHDSFI